MSLSTQQIEQENISGAINRWQLEGRPSSARWHEIWSSLASWGNDHAQPHGVTNYDDLRTVWTDPHQSWDNRVRFDQDLTPFLPASSVSTAIGQTVYDMLVNSSRSDRYDQIHASAPYREMLVFWASDRRTTT